MTKGVELIKTLLVAINAKHCHTAPAVRILKKSCSEHHIDCDYFESTVNESFFSILEGILSSKCDLLVFGVYIWNVTLVKKLAYSIKQIHPDIKIAISGPEVIYTPQDFLIYSYFDYVLCGECEMLLPAFVKAIEGNSEFPNSVATANNCTDIPLAYADFGEYSVGYYNESEITSGRLLYFETSKGCPYSCSYCISSLSSGVRYMDTQTAIDELYRLGQGSKTVKLLDRTFNADPKRALEIWKAIAKFDCTAIYHFEIAPNLLTDEIMEFLPTVPKDRLQFEVGIQSTNKRTLSAIKRPSDPLEELLKLKKLKKADNINIHLDLIAGLPFEDLESFKNSFDESFDCANEVQLGFLKLLRGSHIRNEADIHSYKFSEYEPYEFLSNKYFSFEDLCELKHVEHCLELFGNSGKFQHSLPLLLSVFTPYKLFSELCKVIDLNISYSYKTLYNVFHDFAVKHIYDMVNFREYLKMDYMSMYRGAFPPYLPHEPSSDFRDSCHKFYRNHELLYKILPQHIDSSSKVIEKNTDICEFIVENSKKTLLFDRKCGTIIDITEFFGG